MKVIIPFPAVRQLLMQKELGEKRENWVTSLQEYNIEIKPSKIVIGQGFFKILTGESNIPAEGDTGNNEHIFEVSVIDAKSQYVDLIFYLKNGYAPPKLNYKRKRDLRLKSSHYETVDNVLFRRNYDSILLRCLEKSEAQTILQELHDELVVGHFGGDITAYKILHACYYWPTLFKYTHAYVKKCKTCQTTSRRQQKLALPLEPINIEQPCKQWGLDIIGEIVHHSSKQHKYILTTTDYFTKWVEAISLKVVNYKFVIEFIEQFIIMRFGLPSALIFDNASYISSTSMIEFSIRRGFKLKYSSNYYPC